ncbi:HupE/UreJ family protein [Pseudooceanicola sp. C21-150M6]|uniref:HupE/UreJ family protein n=1 Tax=Pseudooceanicola sp. C21-150M6 TaxID=3434355 RepID=UPI003D7FCCCD
MTEFKSVLLRKSFGPELFWRSTGRLAAQLAATPHAVIVSQIFLEASVSKHAKLARNLCLTLSLAMVATQASAHTGEGINTGFASGFWHPILGWDHVVAMVAVGMWGAFLGAPAIWILPVVFPLVMAFGGALGVLGVPLPMIETGIALSGVVLGLLVAFAVRAPIWVAAVIVGIFAIFHGHAHGTELPEAFSAYGYAVGFVIGTGLLHLAGIAIGFLTATPTGTMAVRAAGGLVALVGAAFLVGVA